jgi:hypothetical protein
MIVVLKYERRLVDNNLHKETNQRKCSRSHGHAGVTALRYSQISGGLGISLTLLPESLIRSLCPFLGVLPGGMKWLCIVNVFQGTHPVPLSIATVVGKRR